MPKEQRDHLLHEIEVIRATIEKLHPQVCNQKNLDAKARLTLLRKVLARDMELLHTEG